MIRSAREGIPDGATNVHASAVVLDGVAVLIRGPSGSGKTHLALSLLAAWQDNGRHAVLLADDQVFVIRKGDRLEAHAPRAIAGLAEIRGTGIVELPHQPIAPVGLVVDLTAVAPSAGAPPVTRIEGVDLACLTLRPRDSDAAGRSVTAAMSAFAWPSEPKYRQNMLACDNDLGLPSRTGRTT
jgi:HPr kinase/phosphorylase